MKRIISIIVITLMFAFDVKSAHIDATLLPQCLQLSNNPNDNNLRSRFQNHKSIKLLKRNLGDGFHLSFEQIKEGNERLNRYSKAMPALQEKLPSLIQQATIFLDNDALRHDQEIYFICGAHSDGFGFNEKGKTILFINLSLVEPNFLTSLMRHEIWHAAFRAQYKKTSRHSPAHEGPLNKLAFIMLNEGVGHYYSFQRRVEPQMTYSNWQERTGKIFALLHEKTALLINEVHKSEQDDFLFLSHANVPFWSKWGALPGAIITYRMKKLHGIRAVKESVYGGPCQFLRSYQLEALKRADWEIIPDQILKAACKP